MVEMWYSYSWTNVREGQVINNWFLLKCHSLINKICEENHNNHQLEDIVLMYVQILRTLMSREMKDSDRSGELNVIFELGNGEG